MVVGVLALGAIGCGGDPKAEPAVSGPPVLRLETVPAEVRQGCREIAAVATTAILCPERMPPPKTGRKYLVVKALKDPREGSVVGVVLSYLAKPQPAIQNTFMHMYFAPTEVFPQIPDRSRPAEVGGRSGTIYPATGHDPSNNHFNFACRIGSQPDYWVSVHSVGRGSRQLLDAMVRGLRPVEMASRRTR
jgi:hypothetical protein